MPLVAYVLLSVVEPVYLVEIVCELIPIMRPGISVEVLKHGIGRLFVITRTLTLVSDSGCPCQNEFKVAQAIIRLGRGLGGG